MEIINQNCIYVTIKYTFNSGKTPFHLAEKCLFSYLISRNANIKSIYRFKFTCCFVRICGVLPLPDAALPNREYVYPEGIREAS
jgi:hypothetical protein